MAERERAEPDPKGTQEIQGAVQVTLDRATYGRARTLADRWGLSVDQALAWLVLDAMRRGGTSSSVADAFPPEIGGHGRATRRDDGLSTDGLDPDEDTYWRELHDLTQDTREGDKRAEAKPASAPAR